MALSPGTRLGPYEITGRLGAGGMGEVYRGRDTRLGRTVAIKVLPADVASNPERRQRLETEARAASALNHPHICVLHDIGSASLPDSAGLLDFLVMELVDGEPLSDRLAKGPLPLDQALIYGQQIADALAAAHQQHIIHRDLKPANVMLTKSGAKLLDFGLAKFTASWNGEAALSALTALATPATAEGTLLGTLAYMAPEQVHGREIDARADIFALGAVLFEMVTGRRAFEGRSPASVIAAILEREPVSLIAIEPASPPLLDRIIRSCLAKDADARIQSATDVALALRWVSEVALAQSPAEGRRRTRARTQPTAAVSRPVVRFAIDVPPSRLVSAIAFSPDGRALAYVGAEADGFRRVYLRRMDQSAETSVPGTEDAGTSAIRFSPDGKSIAFMSGGSVKRVLVTGGEAATIAQVPSAAPTRLSGQYSAFNVLDWAADGSVLFPAGSTGIWRLPPTGGHPTRLTASDAGSGEYGHAFPHLLPNGVDALMTVRTGMQYDAAPLVAVNIETGERQPIVPDGLAAAACAGGRLLLFASGGALLATRFDTTDLRVVGTPIPIVERLQHEYGVPLFGLSRAGDLAYVLEAPANACELVQVDRRGAAQAVVPLPSGTEGAISLSPDGRRAAMSRIAGRMMSACVVDVARGVVESLPFERNAHSLVWLPDGQRLAFSSDRDGAANIFVRLAGGNEPSDRIVQGAQHQDPGSWSRDGKWLAYAEVSPLTSWDIWKYEATSGDRSIFLGTEATERNPAISPSGRWLAYSSDRSGRDEVYVEAFPAGGQRLLVSADGGTEPVWSEDGSELFYLSDRRLTRVSVNEGPHLELGKPELLFVAEDYLAAATYGPAGYAAMPRGGGFLFIRRVAAPPQPTQIHIALGWLDEFMQSSIR